MSATAREHAAPWVRPLRADAGAQVRLFCFPYAGVGPSAFRDWPDSVVDGVEVLGVEYPGREARSAEGPIADVHQLVGHLLPGLLPFFDKPFVFFGHSMGALVAYELTRALGGRHGLRPELLVVSAAAAPHDPPTPQIHALPTKEFLLSLLKLNGMPPEVLGDLELLKHALPILRADFTLCETYRYAVGAPLTCPIMAFGGEADPRVDQHRLAAWRDHAGVAFTQNIVPGDHFFIRSSRRSVVNAINRELIGMIRALSK